MREIDFEYLGQWLSRLGLTADFDAIWPEAFPGEDSPISDVS